MDIVERNNQIDAEAKLQSDKIGIQTEIQNLEVKWNWMVVIQFHFTSRFWIWTCLYINLKKLRKQAKALRKKNTQRLNWMKKSQKDNTDNTTVRNKPWSFEKKGYLKDAGIESSYTSKIGPSKITRENSTSLTEKAIRYVNSRMQKKQNSSVTN